MKETLLRFPVGLIVVLQLGWHSNAFSQTLEEVVITAQRRVQNLQDVPIAVSVYRGEQMTDLGLTNVSELSNYTPNVEMDATSPFSGSSSVLSPFIRGIGQNDHSFNLEPGVGVYVDGVYFARTIGAVVDLLDFDRVEILKGPQGTLFGRNTIGGAINIVTRRPSEELQLQGRLTVGRYNRTDVQGAIDIPIADGKVLSSIAFSSKNRDGYHRLLPFRGSFQTEITPFFRAANVLGGDEMGGENQDNVRAKALWLASDSVEVTFAADFTRVDEPATPTTLIGTNIDPTPGTGTIAGIYNTCIRLPQADLDSIGLTSICNEPIANSGAILGGANVDSNPTNDRHEYGDVFITGDIDTSYAVGSNFNILDIHGTSVTVDWDMSDSTQFKSISAYRSLSAQHGVDIGGAPYIAADASFDTDQEQYSQELQLTGQAFGDRLDWLAGVYLFQEKGNLTGYVPFQAGLIQVLGSNDFDNRSYAVFTHLNYALSDRVSFTAGLRYTDEDKEFEGRQRDLNALVFKLGVPASAFPDPTDVTRIYPIGLQTKDFTDTSSRLGLEWRFNPDMLGYISYSEGFKSGGWTTRLVFPEVPDPNVAPDFDEERARTYEIGLKSQLADRRVQINSAAFTTDYEDIQVNVLRGLSPTFANAGEADILGAEIELSASISDRLMLTSSIGYTDTEYTSLDPAVTPLGLDLNDRLINTPEWDGYLAFDYSIPLENARSLGLYLGASYRSEIANDPQNTPELVQGSTTVVNASVKYAGPDDAWSITFGGRNLGDERYIVSGWDQRSIGHLIANYNRPREWYIAVSSGL